jgi:hypothetical protein
MEWTETLATGISTIDSQHKELFKRINDLVLAIKEHRCSSEIDGTIKFLDDYAINFRGKTHAEQITSLASSTKRRISRPGRAQEQAFSHVQGFLRPVCDHEPGGGGLDRSHS